MAIRNVINFESRRPQVMVFHKTVRTQQQPVQKSNNGALWGAFAGSMIMQLASSILPQILNNSRNEYDLLNQYQKKQLDVPPQEPPKAPLIDTNVELPEDDLTVEDIKFEFDDAELNPKHEHISFKINEIQGNKTYTIEKGDTWYEIAKAKYDVSSLPAGVTLNDVALALAAANSGAEGADALKMAKEGVFFKVGDNVELPDELTVNGQKISLNSNWATADVLSTDYGFVKATHWSIKVQQVGSKWQLLQNGNVIGTFDSEEAAKARKTELMSMNE